MTVTFARIALLSDIAPTASAVIELRDDLARRLNATVSVVDGRRPEEALGQLASAHFDCIVYHSQTGLRLDPTTLLWNLLDRLTTPVMLIPKKAGTSLDIEALVVPVSTEPIASAAVAAALDLAERIERPVELVKVGCTSEFCTCETSVLDSYTDAFHHEYLPRVHELVTSAAPWSSPMRKQWVRDTCHCCCQHIVDLIHHHGKLPSKLIAFEWSSELYHRDLGLLEEAINQAPCKFLLLKPGARAAFILKAGADFFAA